MKKNFLKALLLVVLLTSATAVFFTGCSKNEDKEAAGKDNTTAVEQSKETDEKKDQEENNQVAVENKTPEENNAPSEEKKEDVKKIEVDDSAIPEKVGKALGEYTDDEKAIIAKEIKAAYKAELEIGFNPGECGDGLAHDWDGVVSQNFINGDSTSQAWGLKNLTIIVMNLNGDKQAYVIKNEFVDGYHDIGAPAACGAPISNQYENGGVVKQDFEKGTMVLKDGVITWESR